MAVAHTLPTILLIPGALQTNACYDRLRPLLEEAGFPIVTGSLVSLDPPSPDSCTSIKDGRHLLDSYLLPLIEAGKDVIIYAHSFGATCMTGAGMGLSKVERNASGRPGGVLGLIYMAFITAPDGTSALTHWGGTFPSLLKLDYVRRWPNRPLSCSNRADFIDSLGLA
jgi:hypothetical protein